MESKQGKPGKGRKQFGGLGGYSFFMDQASRIPGRSRWALWWIPALVGAGLFHFAALDRLPPGVCYDGATLACFASNLARGKPPFYGLDRMEGVGDYRRTWAEATLPASACTVLFAKISGIPPERMERAELFFESTAAFLSCVFLGLLAWAVSGSSLVGAAALLALAATPGHFLYARAGPHLFALPFPFWTGAALFLWLGRKKGGWAWGLAGWALVGLSGLFFYASLAGLPLFAGLLTWMGAGPGVGRKEKVRRLFSGVGTALAAYLVPAVLVGWLWGTGPLAVPWATAGFYLGQRGVYSPEGVPWIFLPFQRLFDLVRQVLGGAPRRYFSQAEVEMWSVPGRFLLPVTILLLLGWWAFRNLGKGHGGDPARLWVLGGLLVQPLLVAFVTAGEIRYVAPLFAFAVLGAVLACRPPAGNGDPGPFGTVFLVLAVLLAAGEGAVTGFVTHARNHWGVKPIFLGLAGPAKALERATAGKDPAEVRVLCTWNQEIRYHLALYTDMELSPYLDYLEKLLPEELREDIEKGRLQGKADPALVLKGAKILGAVGQKTRTILVLGLSRDPRLKALGRWCGIRPWRTFPHPFGKGLQWWIYRIP